MSSYITPYQSRKIHFNCLDSHESSALCLSRTSDGGGGGNHDIETKSENVYDNTLILHKSRRYDAHSCLLVLPICCDDCPHMEMSKRFNKSKFFEVSHSRCCCLCSLGDPQIVRRVEVEPHHIDLI